MLLIFFSIFIFGLIVVEDIFFHLILFLVLLLAVVLFNILVGIRKFKKLILKLVFSFILSLLAVFYFNYNYFGKANIDKNFVQNGVVIGTYNNGYELQDSQKRTYRIESNSIPDVGKAIKVFGSYEPAFKNSKFLNSFEKDVRFSVYQKRIQTFLSLEFDYNKWMFMNGIYGHVKESNRYTINKPKTFYIKLRSYIYNKINSVYKDSNAGDLLLGILIGDSSGMSETQYQEFIDSGLNHIMAVSGTHVMLVGVFLTVVLFWVPFYLRIVLVSLLVGFYGLICGLRVSILRAWIMMSIYTIGTVLGRDVSIKRVLYIAYMLILIYNPYSLVYDIGFMFSFGAVLGISYFIKLGKHIPSINKIFDLLLKKYFLASLGAMFGIFPFMIMFIGQVNLASILGNMFILPVLPFLMVYGFISLWIYEILGFEVILFLQKILTNYVYWVVDLLSQKGLFILVNKLYYKYLILLMYIILLICIVYMGNKLKQKDT